MTKRKPIKLWAFKGKTLNWVHITCSSDVLPAEGSGLEKVQALGIEWGGCVEDDPMFRHVKMPEEEEEPTATAATCEITGCTQAAADGALSHETSAD